ncbi:MAG TPA: hypothetical protein VGP15_16150 [Burkholderiales bacterium]|jgi:hypothetical protein|nr:hypothetical protein [Burkholderiales bacterium]
MRLVPISGIAAVLALSAASAFAQQTTPPAKADNQPAPVVMLVPVEISDPALKSGCWAQLYDERNFKGDMLTLVGPMQIDTTDKAGGKQLRRKLDSLVTGPKALVNVYEEKWFKNKSVNFGPNSKEPGLIKKLGFTGSIQSLKIDCVQ